MDAETYIVLCSPARGNCGYPIYGHSMVVDPLGRIISKTGYHEDILYCKIDVSKNDDIADVLSIWNQKKYEQLYKLNKL